MVVNAIAGNVNRMRARAVLGADAAGVWDACAVETELLVQADRLVGGSDAVLDDLGDGEPLATRTDRIECGADRVANQRALGGDVVPGDPGAAGGRSLERLPRGDPALPVGPAHLGGERGDAPARPPSRLGPGRPDGLILGR